MVLLYEIMEAAIYAVLLYCVCRFFPMALPVSYMGYIGWEKGYLEAHRWLREIQTARYLDEKEERLREWERKLNEREKKIDETITLLASNSPANRQSSGLLSPRGSANQQIGGLLSPRNSANPLSPRLVGNPLCTNGCGKVVDCTFTHCKHTSFCMQCAEITKFGDPVYPPRFMCPICNKRGFITPHNVI
jgi:hypothetical protein